MVDQGQTSLPTARPGWKFPLGRGAGDLGGKIRKNPDYLPTLMNPNPFSSKVSEIREKIFRQVREEQGNYL